MKQLGTVKPGSTQYIGFDTFDSNDPQGSVTLTGLALADIKVYKNGSVVERASTAGYTLLDTDGIDFDGLAGIHGFSIDLSNNTTAGFWEAGAHYRVVVDSITVDAGTIRFTAAEFVIGYPDAVINTTIDTLASQTSFTLPAGAGPGNNDALNGHKVLIHDVASAVQTAVGYVSDYVGSTRTVTLAVDPGIFTMAAGDNISIFLPDNVAAWQGVAPNALQSGRLDSYTGAMATDVITATAIQNDAIDANSIANDAITANKVADNSLTANKFAANSLDGKGDWALASVLGALDDVAASGDPTNADTHMQYMKQLVNVLIGAAGITTWPAAVAPGNAVSLAEAIRAVYEDRTIAAANYATAANQTTILNRIGAFTGSGVNTILGFFQGLMRSDATTPSDLGGTYDGATDSSQAIRDRGDAAWATGGGGALSQSLNFQTVIPSSIDLANTATVRIGIILVNAVDDLPSTAEITPGTISIERKAIGGTGWTSVVTDTAMSEQAGMVYYDEVFDSTTGYAAGDSIRVTFKSVSITADANTHVIIGTDGVIEQTYIREAMRGTDGANTTTPPTAAAIVDEWESQSQADPTGFHVNVLEVGSITQTGGDLVAAIAVVDGIVDQILVDTDVTIPGLLATIDANVDAILVDTDVTIPALLATIDTNVDSILLQTGTNGVALSAAQRNAIADHVWRRTLANIRASSDGDSVIFRSPLGAASKLVNKVNVTGSNLLTHAEDDTTVFGTQALTTDASADPITGVDTV